jgi:scyllo-inositol 2-dehydrogenase (NADP+)
VIDDKIIKKKIPTLQGNYYDFFEGVYQSIINDSIEPVTATEGLQVMQIIEAAIASNALGRVIML